MNITRTLGPAFALGMILTASTAVEAQDPPPIETPVPTDTELVFDREVFRYPAFTRRNPFRPLLAADSGGPRFDQLSLIGIMYSDDPSASVAVVSTGGVVLADDGTMSPVDGDAFYMKVGEQVGNVTVREIHRDRVEVTVSEFDDQIPRTMVFVSRRPGGSP